MGIYIAGKGLINSGLLSVRNLDAYESCGVSVYQCSSKYPFLFRHSRESIPNVNVMCFFNSYLADAYTLYASSAIAAQSFCRNMFGFFFTLFMCVSLLVPEVTLLIALSHQKPMVRQHRISMGFCHGRMYASCSP
jgi:hypothetical protein